MAEVRDLRRRLDHLDAAQCGAVRLDGHRVFSGTLACTSARLCRNQNYRVGRERSKVSPQRSVPPVSFAIAATDDHGLVRA